MKRPAIMIKAGSTSPGKLAFPVQSDSLQQATVIVLS
jgi:hypothetical protein